MNESRSGLRRKKSVKMDGNGDKNEAGASKEYQSEETSCSEPRRLEEENDSPRRHSESSNHTRTTASVTDLSGDDDKSNKSSNHGVIDTETCCSDTGRSSRQCAQMVEWTKQFHSLIEEASLLEATVVENQNGGEIESTFGREHGRNTRNEKERQGHVETRLATSDWVDPQLLEEGRKFVRRNFFAVFIAHLIGIAFLLTIRPIQALLLRTSALHKRENTLRRYLKLIVYLKRFYEAPQSILKSDSGGNNDIASIHRLQRNAARNFKIYVPPPWEDLKLTGEEVEIYEALKEDTKQLDDQYGICSNTKILPKILFTVNPDVPMSQYDLVIIQQAFVGFISLFPKLFGIYDKVDNDGNQSGIQGFVHLWAVLGSVFGIEDRFNSCHPQNFDPETNQLIFKQVFLFSFKNINETALRLWRSMTKGSSRYLFFFRTKAMMLFMCKDVAQLENCKYLYSVMKPMERFCYYFCKFLLNWILWVPPFRVLFNCGLKMAIRICLYCLMRAKKSESAWDGALSSVCVIDCDMAKQ